MQRPAGVTIIAILGFVVGALAAIVALLLLIRGNVSVMADMSFYGGAAALSGVVLLGIAALVIATSVGLIMLQEWARILAIILNAVHLCAAALGLMEGLRNIHTLFFFGMMLRHVVMIVIGVWIIVYLIQPKVKQVFRTAAPAAS